MPGAIDRWHEVSLVNQPGATTWPITTFSYMIVDQDLTAQGNKGCLVKKYLEHVFSPLVQGSETISDAPVGKFGFTRLPANVLANNKAGLDSMTMSMTDSECDALYDMSSPYYNEDGTLKPVNCGDADTGFSGAVVAGAAIGCLLGGMLIAMAIMKCHSKPAPKAQNGKSLEMSLDRSLESGGRRERSDSVDSTGSANSETGLTLATTASSSESTV